MALQVIFCKKINKNKKICYNTSLEERENYEKYG